MRGIYILLVIFLSSCSCQSQVAASSTEDLPVLDVQVTEVRESRNYDEILIEKPSYKPLLGRGKDQSKTEDNDNLLEQGEKNNKELEAVEEKKINEKEEYKEESKGKPSYLSDREANETGLSVEEKEKVQDKKDSFVFQPYYSAEIGSQGLFDDAEAATEEGWRISEMEAPSDFLGFTPSGWEVYPIWYYSSPTDSVKYYTLNFYP